MAILNEKAMAALGAVMAPPAAKKTGLADAALGVSNRFVVFAKIYEEGIEKYTLDNGTISRRIRAMFADEEGETKEATMVLTTKLYNTETNAVDTLEENTKIMKTITANYGKVLMFEVSLGKKDTNKGFLYPRSCSIVTKAATVAAPEPEID